ncbi:hypothetical protein BDB01DRAFT_847626 [Pilobolus umbonatus]|nr:hypothetical protein BDB01DRAFT_847626 [Pilobolus umbonatus]
MKNLFGMIRKTKDKKKAAPPELKRVETVEKDLIRREENPVIYASPIVKVPKPRRVMSLDKILRSSDYDKTEIIENEETQEAILREETTLFPAGVAKMKRRPTPHHTEAVDQASEMIDSMLDSLVKTENRITNTEIQYTDSPEAIQAEDNERPTVNEPSPATMKNHFVKVIGQRAMANQYDSSSTQPEDAETRQLLVDPKRGPRVPQHSYQYAPTALQPVPTHSSGHSDHGHTPIPIQNVTNQSPGLNVLQHNTRPTSSQPSIHHSPGPSGTQPSVSGSPRLSVTQPKNVESPLAKNQTQPEERWVDKENGSELGRNDRDNHSEITELYCSPLDYIPDEIDLYGDGKQKTPVARRYSMPQLRNEKEDRYRSSPAPGEIADAYDPYPKIIEYQHTVEQHQSPLWQSTSQSTPNNQYEAMTPLDNTPITGIRKEDIRVEPSRPTHAETPQDLEVQQLKQKVHEIEQRLIQDREEWKRKEREMAECKEEVAGKLNVSEGMLIEAFEKHATLIERRRSLKALNRSRSVEALTHVPRYYRPQLEESVHYEENYYPPTYRRPIQYRYEPSHRVTHTSAAAPQVNKPRRKTRSFGSPSNYPETGYVEYHPREVPIVRQKNRFSPAYEYGHPPRMEVWEDARRHPRYTYLPSPNVPNYVYYDEPPYVDMHRAPPRRMSRPRRMYDY